MEPPTSGQQAALQTQSPPSPQQIGQWAETVFYRCAQYSRAHCQIASNPMMSPNVSAATKTVFGVVCGTQQLATTLLQDQPTKICVITKLICYYLQSNIFRVETFRGLDSTHDNIIAGIQGVNYDSMPVPVRTVLLRNLIDSFDKLARHPRFQAHRNTIVKNHAEALWPTVQTLFGHKTTADYADLEQMMGEAVDLCGHLFKHPARYIFTYFRPGDAFLNNEMQVTSHTNNTIPGQVLQNQGYTVAFCVTPRIGMRTYTLAGHITTTTITKATVLCNPAPAPQPAQPPKPPGPAPTYDPRKLIGRRQG